MERVAVCHDWLNGMRGGEKCLQAVLRLYPRSEIFTLLLDRARISDDIAAHHIHTSFIQSLPFARKLYRSYLPLFPFAVTRFDLSRFDTVISISHCVAKGVKRPERGRHVCYCSTPMRYAWFLFDDYFGRTSRVQKKIIELCLSALRKWDRENSGGVDRFIAISECVRERIQRCYGRESVVVYPPVDTSFYCPGDNPPAEDFYLVVSALVPYKRIDLAVDTFNALGKRLLVVGAGPESARLQRRAKNNIRFVGWQKDEYIRDCYRRARALVFPGFDDFGIVPVEMQSCGGPVIALRKGGALETVVDGLTGVFFEDSTVESLADAISRFERTEFSRDACRAHALKFGEARFMTEFREAVCSGSRGILQLPQV